MTGQTSQQVIQAIRRLYTSDEMARQLFDHLAQRKNNSASTAIDRLRSLLRISLSEAVALARTLEEAGCGTYVVGRRGGVTRFVWDYTCISLGLAASGQASEIVSLAADLDDEEEDEADHAPPPPAPLALTIPQAKEALSRALGVPPDKIEIIIKA